MELGGTMKKVRKLSLGFVLSAMSSMAFAGVEFGTVYGEQKWTAYIGSGNGIYIKRGSTAFKDVCNTGLVSKGKYVLTPSGKSLVGKNKVLTEIQRRLVKGKIKGGCK